MKINTFIKLISENLSSKAYKLFLLNSVFLISFSVFSLINFFDLLISPILIKISERKKIESKFKKFNLIDF